jgi:hypothetical protein
MTGLVLDLVQGQPLAAKPTSQHLLRCKWAPGTSFSVPIALHIASSLASALVHLHEKVGDAAAWHHCWESCVRLLHCGAICQ